MVNTDSFMYYSQDNQFEIVLTCVKEAVFKDQLLQDEHNISLYDNHCYIHVCDIHHADEIEDIISYAIIAKIKHSNSIVVS